MLLDDGRVLVAGGVDGRRTALDAVTLYDPETNVWSASNPMLTSRRDHTVTQLKDGRVLVAGGESGKLTFPFDGLATAELFDLKTETWTETGAMHTARWGHTATRLPSGKVLVAGGAGARTPESYQSWSSAELFDPGSGTWTPVDDMTDARMGHTAVLLADGNVLVIGGMLSTGRGDGVALGFCELYNSDTGRWTPTGSLTMPRMSHTTALLPDGSVLVAGGWVSTVPVGWNYQEYSQWSVERYDSVAGLWSADSNLPGGRADHKMVLLSSGQLLLAGGTEAANPDTGYPSVLLYDPRLRLWSTVAPMTAGRFGFGLVALKDGRALAIGGIDRAGQARPHPGDDEVIAATETYGEYVVPKPPTQEELDDWLRQGEEWSRVAAVDHREGRDPDAVAAERKAAVFFLRLRRARQAYTWRWAHSAVYLGIYLSYAGSPDEAAASEAAAIDAFHEIGDRPLEAWAGSNLSAVLDRAGRYPAAVNAQQQVRSIYTELAAADPNYRGILAQTNVFLGQYLSHANRPDEAVSVTEEAINLYQQIGDQGLTGWAYTNLAAYCSAAARYPAAAAAQTEACRIYRNLAATDPSYRPVLAQAAVILGGVLVQTSQYGQAIAAIQEGIDLYRALADRPLLAWALGNLRAAAQAANRLPAAIAAGQEARDIYAGLAAADPAYKPLLADAALRLTQAMLAANDHAAALTPAREAVDLYTQLTAADPTYAARLALARQLLDQTQTVP
nr:kelch repeat-containing protein [Kribbella solani]